MNKRIINNKWVVLDKTFEVPLKDIEELKNDTKKLENKNYNEKNAKEILAEAQKKAEKIIEESKETSEKILKNAQIEAQKLKKEQIIILNNKKKELENELEDIKANFQRISKEYQIYIEELSKQSFALSENVIKSVVEKFLNQELDSPNWIEIIYKNFENKLSSFKNAKIKLSPSFNKDYEKSLREKLGQILLIMEDTSLKDNQIILETDEGIFDLTPQTFIEDILSILEESMNENN